MSARERFEKWATASTTLDLHREGLSERYYFVDANLAYSAWLAAKADDAEICDRLCVSIVSGSFPALATAHASVVVATCAETIRDSAKDGPS